MSFRSFTKHLLRASRFLVPLALLAQGGDALAYRYVGYCYTPTLYEPSALDEMRNACSIASGQPTADAYFASIARWNEVSNKPVRGTYVRPASECHLTLGDWTSEVGRSPRANIDGNNGLTTYSHENVCFDVGGYGDYSEADVQVADDAVTSPPATSFATNTSAPGNMWATLPHEIGHQLALADTADFEIMSRTNPRVITALGPSPLPGDIAGVRGLYGTKTLTNLMVTAQRWDSRAITVVDNNGVGQNVCQSGTILLTWTALNPGSASLSIRQGMRLSPSPSDPFASGSRWMLVEAGVTIGARSVLTRSAAVTASGLPVGRQHLYHVVDPSSELAETHEDDNIVRQYGSIFVSAC